MRVVVRRVVAWAAFVVCLVGAFYFGAHVGFVEGRAVEIGRNAATDAFWVSQVLSALRAQNQQDALKVLEDHLDGAIMSHGVHILAGPPKFELQKHQFVEGFKMLGPAAAYRAAHPTASENPEVRATITGISACLSEAKLGESEESVRAVLQACYRGVW